MTYKVLPKPAKSNRQVKSYLRAVEEGARGRFVIPNGKGWHVRKASSHRGKLFDTKKEAVHQARKEAKELGGEVFVFDKSGKLINREA